MQRHSKPFDTQALMKASGSKKAFGKKRIWKLWLLRRCFEGVWKELHKNWTIFAVINKQNQDKESFNLKKSKSFIFLFSYQSRPQISPQTFQLASLRKHTYSFSCVATPGDAWHIWIWFVWNENEREREKRSESREIYDLICVRRKMANVIMPSTK